VSPRGYGLGNPRSFLLPNMNLPAGVPVTSRITLMYSEISLGKTNILLSIPATSTISVLSLCRALDFGSMCYLIRRGRPVLIASVCSFCSSVQTTWFGRAANRLLQMVSHPTHPCLLLSLG
jgi:hypothetical protein